MAVVKAAARTKFHDLRITASSPTRGTRLWLDGFELKGVAEYVLRADTKDVTRLELHLVIESINADAELLRKLLEGS